MRTDAAGRLTVRGFAGDYTVSTPGGEVPFGIVPGASTLDIMLR
jgi:hypothetical protein